LQKLIFAKEEKTKKSKEKKTEVKQKLEERNQESNRRTSIEKKKVLSARTKKGRENPGLIMHKRTLRDLGTKRTL